MTGASPTSPDGQPLIRIASLAGPHGLAGDVNLRTADDSPDWTDGSREAFVAFGATLKTVRLQSVRMRGPGMARVRFEGMDSRTALEQTLGAALSKGALYLRKSELPPPPPGQFRIDALIGLNVLQQSDGRTVGVVRDVLSAGGSDFLEIMPVAGGEAVVAPFNAHFFPHADPAAGRLIVAHLDGFFDADDASA